MIVGSACYSVRIRRCRLLTVKWCGTLWFASSVIFV